MLHQIAHYIQYALAHFGYAVPLVFVMIESMGVPFPGESAVIAASVYANRSHHLNIYLVILCAAAGAIIGDNIAYLLGRTGGYHVIHKHPKPFKLNDRRLKYGVYLFRRHGAAIVFFGRWLTLLRMWAGVLAGANCMDWKRFALFNALGGLLWSICFGILGYELANNIRIIETWVAAGLWVIFGGTVAGCLIYFFRNEQRLEDEAERALPESVKRRVATER